ncbi:MAG TPA: PP2C family protein-serine/threonine phosphatase [Fimbriiglobus sp.]|jgi:sigma-B regulation protein RsbU (phosphoserine phosphatase)|nr:PP2C family protein-serine/threonine phosphatase [Fimbriiglobus sp.]
MTVAADFFEITPRNWRARWTISVDVMRELSRYSDPDEMYHVFAQRMSQLYPTSRQVSLTRRGLSRPQVQVTRFNLWAEQVNPFKQPDRLPVVSGGLLADLIYSDEPRVIDDLHLRPDDPAAEYLAGQRSLLAIPLFEDGVATNMVVVTREESAAFPREQVPELVWMTNLFGRAIQSQVLTQRLHEANQATDYELRAIADLQHSLLPGDVPQVPGLELAAHYKTANRAGGDYYDFFPLPGGRLGVLVADVSGHGTPAAVLMAITHSLTHAYPSAPARPGELLAYLNTHLARRYTVTTGHFVTAFYAVFDPAASAMTYANAGHAAPRASTADGRQWVSLPTSHGLPLGVMSRDAAYPEQTIPFSPGDRVAIFTDGMTDAVNRTGEPFGPDRLDAGLGDGGSAPDEVVTAITDALDRFTLGQPVQDDRTLVVVRRT